ncbi:MAG: hypothetical protein ACYS4W_11070 [Planctomycetota bacterium]|jgi:hypothetical protein
MTQEKPYNAKLVLKALENPNYKWRSILGICKETGLSQNIVEKVIAQRRQQIIRARSGRRPGRIYYTTRKHFREKGSPLEKMLGAIRNRIR